MNKYIYNIIFKVAPTFILLKSVDGHIKLTKCNDKRMAHTIYESFQK